MIGLSKNHSVVSKKSGFPEMDLMDSRNVSFLCMY